MINLGDEKKVKKDGVTRTFRFSACTICGKGRWVALRNGILSNQRCKSCAAKLAVRPHKVYVLPSNPNLGDITRGDCIGKRVRDMYMWCTCKFCGKERWVRLSNGKPRSMACQTCANKPQNSPLYKKVTLTHNGYQLIKIYLDDPYYSMARRGDKVALHRYIMAKYLGRPLTIGEVVHHKNGIKDDNRIGNPELVSDHLHKGITALEQRVKFLENRVTILEVENVLLRESTNA